MKDAGYYALDALRIEAGRRAWGAELGPDEKPFEAGLLYAVKLEKQDDFIGRSALLRLLDQPLRKKLVTVVLETAAAYAWGGETMLDRRPSGRRTGFRRLEPARRRLRRPRLPARRRGGAPHAGTPLEVDLWGAAGARRRGTGGRPR